MTELFGTVCVKYDAVVIESQEPRVGQVASLSTTAMADIQQLLSVLDVFGRAPDRDALEKANAWLQDFQHSVRNKFSALGHRHA